jgi:hypothetical protein
MRHRALAVALAALLALSACGDDDDGNQAANSTTTAEATTTSTGDALCAAIDDAEQDIRARLWPLPVRRLHGVGPKAAAKLALISLRESAG